MTLYKPFTFLIISVLLYPWTGQASQLEGQWEGNGLYIFSNLSDFCSVATASIEKNEQQISIHFRLDQCEAIEHDFPLAGLTIKRQFEVKGKELLYKEKPIGVITDNLLRTYSPSNDDRTEETLTLFADDDELTITGDFRVDLGNNGVLRTEAIIQAHRLL